MKMGRLVFLKILGGIALLMVLSLGAAVLWIQHAPQKPEDREPASVSRAIFVDQGAVSADQVLAQTAISNPLRARRVAFDSAALGDALEHSDGFLELSLFNDKKVRIRLQNASNYRVNEHLVVGQLENDPSSVVRMQVFEDSIDGQILGSNQEFRIVPLGRGQLMIVETRTKTAK